MDEPKNKDSTPEDYPVPVPWDGFQPPNGAGCFVVILLMFLLSALLAPAIADFFMRLQR